MKLLLVCDRRQDVPADTFERQTGNTHYHRQFWHIEGKFQSLSKQDKKDYQS